MSRIVTLTVNPAVDKSSRLERVVPDRKLRCEKPRFEPGGGGLNVSRAVKKLGGESTTVYTVGGPPGDLLRHLLEKESLECRAVEIAEWTRQNLMVYESASGNQFRFGMPGPQLAESEWQHCLDVVAGLDPVPEYLVASGSLPPGVPTDFYARVAQICSQNTVRLIVDTSGAPLAAALEAGVYLVKPNMNELADIAGCEISDESHQEECTREVISRGRSEAVMLTLGSAGALLAWENGLQRLRAPSVNIQSKVGAGDSTVAGLVLALTRGMDLPEAARFGIAAGAAAVMTPGSELCRREDAERLYRKIAPESE
jgi:6-phosphofructokinase 2